MLPISFAIGSENSPTKYKGRCLKCQLEVFDEVIAGLTRIVGAFNVGLNVPTVLANKSDEIRKVLERVKGGIYWILLYHHIIKLTCLNTNRQVLWDTIIFMRG